MSFVVETIVAAAIELLIDKLISSELLNIFREEQLLIAHNKWVEQLGYLQALLTNAEEKQVTNKAVKIWLGQLRDLAFDAEDILDEFQYEALRRKNMEESRVSTSRIRSLIPAWCTSFAPRNLAFRSPMKFKIEEITGKLEQLLKQKGDLAPNVDVFGQPNKKQKRLPTTSLVEESDVYGRQNDKEAILQLLLAGNTSASGVRVIPIFGLGGIGKTTLAQLIYNDERVKEEFDVKSWACVSDDFDVIGATASILRQVGGENCDHKDLNLLQEKLKERLSKKKFFIVLDDIWNENDGDCDLLCRPFKVGAPGSAIIVTTRSKTVAKNVGNVSAYELQKLSDNDCLCLLAHRALGQTSFDSSPDLKPTGEEIARRCKGLPLAAKALGGLLRDNYDPSAWENVLTSKIWEIPEEKCGIIPALRLSYHHLPSHLKRCFAYCSIFPKDYKFDRDELILLWMAEGYLAEEKGNKRMEDLGLEYFQDLLARSLFQNSDRNSSYFIMHDMVHDLSQIVAEETCIRLDEILGDNERKIGSARHSSYTRKSHEHFKRFEVFHDKGSLRTFLPMPVSVAFYDEAYISINVLQDLFSQLKFLRVLSLSGYQISELPDSVTGLKHLRYMNLSRTRIKCLPQSLCSLYYLQTLILKDCQCLSHLPTNIHDLTNLRHLDIRGTRSLQELPAGLGHLKYLRTLSKFTVGKGSGLGLGELGCLNHIGGEISILDLRNVVHIREASAAKLKEKKRLRRLELHWGQDFEDDSRNDANEFQVLDSLMPHSGSLKELEIWSYGGLSFPSWIGDSSFFGLVDLRLDGCKKCKKLPCLGQLPSLQRLKIMDMDEVESVGWEFCSSHADASHSSQSSPFPSLESLQFRNMTKWVDWSLPDTSFAKLICLEIYECPLLVFPLSRLNSTASHLQRLALRGCSDAIIRDSNIELASLKSLSIGRISGLSFLPDEFLLPKVEELQVDDCSELERLLNGFCMLASLKKLHIRKCAKLVYLELPLMLRILDIEDCEALRCVTEGSNSICSLALSALGLESLRITGCPSLTSISGNQWFRNIEHLRIYDCESLEVFPSRQLPTTLKSLDICSCPKLETVSEMLIESTSLPFLRFYRYPKLKSLPECLHTLTDLACLGVVECEGIEKFPVTGLPTPNLQYLEITDCPNLKSLPNNIHDLTSLRELRISNCPLLGLRLPPNLRYFTIGEPSEALITFPNNQFLVLPPSLTSLTIMNFSDLESISSPGLLNLTSLVKLWISDCPKLQHLPETGFLNLTSLQELGIYNCPELQHLPETGLRKLTSLEVLRIDSCAKLRRLPETGLPPTLLRLEISGCPLLAPECLNSKKGKKQEGVYWPHIALIPYVEIDRDVISA